MDWFTLAIVLFVLAGLGVKLGLSFRSGPPRRVIERFARDAGLALTPEIEPALTRRIAARDRGFTIGTMTALVGIGVWAIEGTTAAWSGIVLVAIMLIGAVVGLGVAEWRAAFTPAPDGPRVARATTPTLADYLSPVDRWANGVAILLAISGVVAVLAVFSAGLIALLPAIVLAAVALATAGVSWIAGAALLKRGQPAASVTELTWDDALRSDTLRTIVQIPMILGAASLTATLFALGADPAASSLTSPGLLVVGAAVLACTIFTNQRRATTRYLRRLWPDSAAGHSDAIARGAAA